MTPARAAGARRRAIAFIPARKGSRAVPRKNIHPILGRPLIEYTFDAALDAKRFAQVIVSTDDPDARTLAKARGLRVHDRPAHLATDEALISDVIADFLAGEGLDVVDDDLFVLLQATSPLRRAQHIIEAIALFDADPEARALVSVTPFEWPPEYGLREAGRYVEPAVPAAFHHGLVRRTDAEPRYRPNGAIYVSTARTVRAERSFYGEATLPYRMIAEDSIDIDTLLDCQIVEALMRFKRATEA